PPCNRARSSGKRGEASLASTSSTRALIILRLVLLLGCDPKYHAAPVNTLHKGAATIVSPRPGRAIKSSSAQIQCQVRFWVCSVVSVEPMQHNLFPCVVDVGQRKHHAAALQVRAFSSQDSAGVSRAKQISAGVQYHAGRWASAISAPGKAVERR